MGVTVIKLILEKWFLMLYFFKFRSFCSEINRCQVGEVTKNGLCNLFSNFVVKSLFLKSNKKLHKIHHLCNKMNNLFASNPRLRNEIVYSAKKIYNIHTYNQVTVAARKKEKKKKLVIYRFE